jgi:hypothetical protein
MDRDPDEQPADDIEAQRGDQPGERHSRRLLESEEEHEPPDGAMPVDKEIEQNDRKM